MANDISAEMKLREIVARVLQRDLNQIALETRFREDLGADSLDLIVLLHEIENDFNVDIPDSQATTVRNIGDALRLMKELEPS